MRRRLDLAAGLVTQPPVLFLDEPTTGLDPTSRVRMWDVIRELVADGVTLLLTTQYLDEADELADQIVVDRPRPRHRQRHARRAQGADRRRTARDHAAPSADTGRVDSRLRPLAAGDVHVSHDGRRLRAPVRSGAGLATAVVRALDQAGITVDDVEVHQPSLDDVFFALTGHATSPNLTSSPMTRHLTRAGGRTMTATLELPATATIVTTTRPPGVWRQVVDVAVAHLSQSGPHRPRAAAALGRDRPAHALHAAVRLRLRRRRRHSPRRQLREFAIAGMIALNLTTSAMGTAVGLSNDLNSGVIDRFRTLPMWRPAVLGRAIDRRPASPRRSAPRSSPAPALASAGGPSAASCLRPRRLRHLLLFSYALSWGCACLGIIARAPSRRRASDSSSCSRWRSSRTRWCRPQHMPAVLRDIANWNPVSAVTAAARQLFGNPNPSALSPRVADAAPDRGVAAVVARAARDLRAARDHPVPTSHDGLITGSSSGSSTGSEPEDRPADLGPPLLGCRVVTRADQIGLVDRSVDSKGVFDDPFRAGRR